MLIAFLALAAAVPAGCNSPRSEAAMNRCAAAAYADADAEMTRQWKITYSYASGRDAQSSTSGGAIAQWRARLLLSQRAWLSYRDAECSVESASFAGGSAQPVALDQCRTRLTIDRTQELKTLVRRR